MPLILGNRRSLFLHIPKTGGTWLRCALRSCAIKSREYDPHHGNLEECMHLLPDIPRFTILRNPFDWYASYWAMRQIKEGAIKKNHRNWALDLIRADKDFNAFIQKSCLEHAGFLNDVYNQFTGAGVLTLRTESLRLDLANHLTNIGEQFDRRRLYDTPIPNPGASDELFRDKVTYTKETTELLAHSEREIFQRFGYSAHPREVIPKS